MGDNRSRAFSPRRRESRPKKIYTEEEKLAREKERIRKLQITLNEQDGRHYQSSPNGSANLLDALRREHPERDPDKQKKE